MLLYLKLLKENGTSCSSTALEGESTKYESSVLEKVYLHFRIVCIVLPSCLRDVIISNDPMSSFANLLSDSIRTSHHL